MACWPMSIPYKLTRFICFVLLFIPTITFGSERVALVVGNATYLHGPDLKTPLNDSAEIAKLLRKMGYDTALVQNGTKAQVMLALAHLRIRSQTASKVVVYFAGHGMQKNGQSFLFPTDGIFSGSGMQKNLIPLTTITRAISDKARQKLVFIDACRDDPSYQIDYETVFTAPRTFIPAGLYVLHAAQPGAAAFDGATKHSPFAQAFLDHGRSTADVEVLAKHIRVDVIRATQGLQLPWSQSSLMRPASLH